MWKRSPSRQDRIENRLSNRRQAHGQSGDTLYTSSKHELIGGYALTGLNDLPFLDYSKPTFQAEPFLWLAGKAKDLKLARSDRGVEILDYQMCRAFLINRAFGTDHANLVEKMGLPDSRALEFKRRMLLTQNRNETRKRIRNTLTQLIGPSEAEAM